MRVHADSVTVGIDGIRIVENATLTAPPGSMIGIIGPNGSGKSTLLKALYRAVRPETGAVRIGDDDLWTLSARESAQRASVVLQDDSSEFAFTVRETVETGRVPHTRLFGRPGASEAARASGISGERAVNEAMRTAGVLDLAERLLATLSGGQRQRVFVARALAQQTPVMLLDEPTNHLDIAAQLELMELLRSLPLTVVAVLHDLNLAAAYCDGLYVVSAGRLIAHGPVEQVLTPATIAAVYGVDAHCGRNPLTGRPTISFGPRAPALRTPTTDTAATPTSATITPTTQKAEQ